MSTPIPGIELSFCLLAAVNGSFDPAYPHYYRDFRSVIHGIDSYVPRMATSEGQANFVYFHNLEWDGCSLAVVEKAGGWRTFEGFDDYFRFLVQLLESMRSNMEDRARRWPYSMIGTLSSGYDSTTVTALARCVGLQKVVCFKRGESRDDGAAIASHFGVEPVVVSVDEWSHGRMPEVRFLAANSFGEDIDFSRSKAV